MKIKDQLKTEIQKLKDNWDRLSQRDKIIVAILTIIIPCFLYYKFILTPKIHEINKLQKKEQQLSIKLNDLKLKKIQLAKLKKEEKKIQSILDQAQKILPERTEISELLNNIAKEGRKFNVTITKFQAKSEVIAENKIYTTIPIEIELEGDFHNIMLFIDNLRFQERILIPQKLIAKSEKGILKANCNINTYRLLTKEEIKQLKEKEEEKKNKKRKKK